jgi:hypothetical protein
MLRRRQAVRAPCSHSIYVYLGKTLKAQRRKAVVRLAFSAADGGIYFVGSRVQAVNFTVRKGKAAQVLLALG